MSKSLVSQLVAALVAKGLVVQSRDEENRRRVRLALTAAGQRALTKIYQELAHNASNLFDVLGTARPQFLQSLRRLREALIAGDAQDACNDAAGKARKSNAD